MIALDTNILIYAHRSGYQEHASARHALESMFTAGLTWGIPLPCLAEFWSIVTHQKMGNRPSSPKEAMEFISFVLEDGDGQLLLPGSDFGVRLMDMAFKLDVSGVRVFDLQIGLAAHDNGAEVIWTHDRGFLTIPGIRCLDPLLENP